MILAMPRRERFAADTNPQPRRRTPYSANGALVFIS